MLVPWTGERVRQAAVCVVLAAGLAAGPDDGSGGRTGDPGRRSDRQLGRRALGRRPWPSAAAAAFGPRRNVPPAAPGHGWPAATSRPSTTGQPSASGAKGRLKPRVRQPAKRGRASSSHAHAAAGPVIPVASRGRLRSAVGPHRPGTCDAAASRRPADRRRCRAPPRRAAARGWAGRGPWPPMRAALALGCNDPTGARHRRIDDERHGRDPPAMRARRRSSSRSGGPCVADGPGHHRRRTGRSSPRPATALVLPAWAARRPPGRARPGVLALRREADLHAAGPAGPFALDARRAAARVGHHGRGGAGPDGGPRAADRAHPQGRHRPAACGVPWPRRRPSSCTGGLLANLHACGGPRGRVNDRHRWAAAPSPASRTGWGGPGTCKSQAYHTDPRRAAPGVTTC